MLGWIFRKKGDAPAPAPTATAAAPRRAAASSVPVPVPAPAPAVDWPARLALAQGQAEALLALARTAGAPLQVRQAAVEALDGEAALVQAEREFRSHDRRIHQLAKRRLLEKVAQRQTRERAAELIETARKLAGETDAPVNRGVELDHAWRALDSTAIEAAQRDEFATLTAQLDEQWRQRADAELQRKRWHGEIVQALSHLQAASTHAAAGTQDRSDLAAAASAARAVLERAAPGNATPGSDAALTQLHQALAVAEALEGQLAALELLLAGSTEALQQPAADLADPHLAALVQARREHWQQAQDQAHQQQLSQRKQQARERQRAHQDERQTALADQVALAEAALDAGQLAEAHQLLNTIDAALKGAEAPEALHTRIAATQARLAQLRGWQHWAGGRARDELVLQAEALAAATLGAGDEPGQSAADAEVARLSIRQRAEVIATLRARWKEIDRTGGAGARALWQRFDAALTTAHEPVAAQAAAQRAARETNLAARQQLLDTLEAALAEPQAEDSAPAEAAAAPQALAAALDRFQVEWRRLGPLEHTVPRAAQAALAARRDAAVQRVEVPLQAARQRARAERQALLARAQGLAGHVPGRDLVGEARTLQAEWQRQAKALSLGRGEEQALWVEFKGAIDAAFAAREAVFNARDAELEAHAAERLALIERLQIRAEDSTTAQRRTLAEVEAAWQRCGPAPRARAAALDAEFRSARAALRQWVDDAAARAWQSTCDALEAKLALCLEREQAGPATADASTLAAAWQALPALPAPLEDALRRRAGLAPADSAHSGTSVDELLLQVEIAWDLPTPPAFESLRRERRLLEMKAALEGRSARTPSALSADAALALALGRSGLDGLQHKRLGALLAALRKRGLPGPR